MLDKINVKSEETIDDKVRVTNQMSRRRGRVQVKKRAQVLLPQEVIGMVTILGGHHTMLLSGIHTDRH
jgi:hypothetical protein